MSQIINEDILWVAAEKLRDKCDPVDYKNIILELVFLKYEVTNMWQNIMN